MNDSRPAARVLPFDIHRQPDDTTCGPTCLQAVYRYWGQEVPLPELVDAIPALDDGGTLGVLLGLDALRRGFRARLVTWNLRVFDPSWFAGPASDLPELLRAEARLRGEQSKLGLAAACYADFVAAGGTVELRDLSPALLMESLERGVPVLTGLSATYLYREPRQDPETDRADPLGGQPVGHFVVLTGFDAQRREVLVTDPMHPNPLSEVHTYTVGIERLVGAIYLGVLTYDGNLLVVEPSGCEACQAEARDG